MFVRLYGPGSGPRAAGKWTDAATGEHGDLLDVIRDSCGLVDFRDAIARPVAFSACRRPSSMRNRNVRSRLLPSAHRNRRDGLFAMSQPIHGTIAETYLRNRGITDLHETTSLRFHPALLL